MSDLPPRVLRSDAVDHHARSTEIGTFREAEGDGPDDRIVMLLTCGCGATIDCGMAPDQARRIAGDIDGGKGLS